MRATLHPSCIAGYGAPPPTLRSHHTAIPRSTLNTLTSLPLRHPAWVLGSAVAAVLLCAVAFLRMRLDPDVESILGGPSAATFREVAESFGWRERANLLLEVDEPEAGRDRAADLVALAAAIHSAAEAHPQLLGVHYGSGLPGSDGQAGDGAAQTRDLLFPHGLVLLDDPEQVAVLLTRDGLVSRLEQQIERLDMPGLGDQDVFLEQDPLGLQLLLAPRLTALRGGYDFAPGEQHFLSTDRNALLAVGIGRHDPDSTDPVRIARAMDEAIATGRAAVGGQAAGITVHRTGNAYFTEETQRVIAGDLSISLSASILLAMGMLAVAFRMALWRVALLLLPTMWGAAVGLGIFVALQETVSLLSFACAAILIGLGIDFTIHVTTAALQERSFGTGPTRALLRALRETRGRLTLAAVTSASAFLAFLTAEAGFLQDMGLLTALGLFTCLLSPFVVLPAILLPVLRRATPANAVGTAPFAMTRWCAALAGRPLAMLGGTAALMVAALVWMVLEPPQLEDDLRNLHSADSVPLAVQGRLQQRFGGSLEPLLLLVEGANPSAALTASAGALDRLAPLQDRGVFQAVTSAATVLPDPAGQEATLQLLRQRTPEEASGLLRAALAEVGFDPEEFTPYIEGFGTCCGLDQPVLPEDLVAGPLGDLAERFVAAAPTPDQPDRHRGLVLLEPTGALWDGDSRNGLLAETRTALAGLPGVVGLTGTLPTAAESAEMVAGSFGRVSLLTLLAVVIVLTFRFRHPGHIVMVLIPAAVGTVLCASVFTAAGMRLNLMNMGVIPMVLALGIDDGIHVVAHGLARSGAGRRVRTAELLGATGTGVLLTSLTTMVTFGSLALSANRGLASVGVLSFVGIAVCLLASLLTLPALLQWRGYTSAEPVAGRPPRAHPVPADPR